MIDFSRRAPIFAWLRASLLAIDDSLRADMIVEGASLMTDLGLDSLRLEELVARIKTERPELDLTPWYVRAARSGQDTVGSLVDFLVVAGRAS
jgi:aryl carrier-like protein